MKELEVHEWIYNIETLSMFQLCASLVANMPERQDTIIGACVEWLGARSKQAR